MKLKKVSALLIAAVMVGTAFTGCAGKAAAPAAASTADAASTASVADQVASAAESVAADASSAAAATSGKKIVLGFAQVGAESGWRTAETASIKDIPTKYPNIELKFSDAQQKQENQLKAVRTFIAQKVDVIAIDPVVSTGWDTVLKEAQQAKIPVVIVDRSVDADASLYNAFLGSDMEEEGKKAAQVVIDQFGDKPCNIVEIQGTMGSSAQTGRDKGFDETIASHSNIKVIKKTSGDFVRAKGKEVMEAFLKSDGDKFNCMISQNDDMAVGAVQAIDEAGKKAGSDIFIVSYDGIKDMFKVMADGKSNAIVECNPLLGPQLADLATAIVNGATYEKVIKSNESVFLQKQAAAELPNRKY
jgi:galactofuranose transport system substrate-binding protein